MNEQGEANTKSRDAFVMRISAEETNITLELAGELDMSSASLLRTEVEAALESAAPRVIVDLSELKFIDSSGIKTLFNAWRHPRGGPDRLTIRNAQGLVEKVLALSGLDSILLEDH